MQEFDPITGAPITPMNNAAMLAGGSKPMTAMDNPYQTGQANMNPNFIGGMANSNMPTTGMFAQEKIANLQPQIPLETSIVLNNIKSATDSGKDNVEKAIAAKGAKMPTGTVAQEKKMKDYLLTGVTVDAEVSTKNPMNVIGPNKDLANFRPTEVKPDSENPGIEGEQSPKSVVLNYNEVNDAKLDERKRNSRVQHGAQANRDESFRNKLKKRSAALGVPDPVDSILNQDKAMPKGAAGKGIRGLAPNVQEKMGYDPLSQERLTQSRRGTKCMRVKRK
jgi:hypothetical protein